jgi:TolB-like protein/Tfp pilus assembly protein PilF
MHEASPSETAVVSDAFVSYASPDAPVANAVVEILEQHGIKCWIAPRNVTPGSQYADEIVGAINNSKVLVLVLSEHAAESAHVGREIERAASKRRRIFVLRTDATPLTRSFEYFLSDSQWIDVAALGMPAALTKLTQAVGQRLSPSSWVSPGLGTDVRDPAERRRKPSYLTIKRLVATAVFLVVAALIVGVMLRYWPSKQAPQAPVVAAITDKSIAVLPFADMSEKKDQEYVGEGIAEEISALLAKIQHVKVIGRLSSFQFKGRDEDLRTIGEKLHAAYIVEGSVRKVGSKVRVTAQLVDAHSGNQLWADNYDDDFSDVLELQQHIATGIARALQLVVEADGAAPLAPLRSQEAYTFYLRGLSELDQWHQSSLFDAQSNFERALALDASFLRAAEALAQTHVEQAFDESRSPKLAWQDAREAADRALQLDPNSAPAHAILGLVFATHDFNWDAAQAEFRHALAVRPRDPITMRFAALLAHALGKQEEALRYINAAISIDPLNPHLAENLGQILYAMGDLDRAEPAYRKGLEIEPLSDGNHFYLSIILQLKGQREQAQREARAEVAENARDAGMSMDFFARGQIADSDAALARLKSSSAERWPFGIAQTYAFRRDQERTFEWLDRSYDLRDPDCLLNVRGDPLLNFLRGDPRYKALLKKMKLPE